MLTGAADKTAKLWDVATKKCVKTFTFGSNAIDFMQVGVLWPQPDVLISLGLNSDMNYLDLDNPSTPKKVVHGHNKKIYSLVYNDKTNQFFSAGADGVLIRWDLGLGTTAKPTGNGHTTAIGAIAIQGNFLVTGAVDQSVKFIDLNTFAYVDADVKLDAIAADIAVSANNSDLMLIVTTKNLVIFNGQQVKKVIDLKGYEGTSVSIAPNDAQIVIGGSDKKAYVYSFDGDDITQVGVLDQHRGKISRVRYSPDGTMIAVGDGNREIIVWDQATLKEKYTGLVYHTSNITDLSWSKSNNYLVSSSVDKSLIVWNLAAGKRTIADCAHLQGVNAVAFVDDNTVLSVGQDYCCKSWSFKF